MESILKIFAAIGSKSITAKSDVMQKEPNKADPTTQLHFFKRKNRAPGNMELVTIPEWNFRKKSEFSGSR